MRLSALVVMALPALVAAASALGSQPASLGSASLGSQGGSQFQNVTLSSDKVYERLGKPYYIAGVICQIAALLCMLVLAILQVVQKCGQAEMSGFEAVWSTPQITTFVLTVLAYGVLDGLYRPTFIGSNLRIFNVNSTCTGVVCKAPYSVIAGGAKAALAESCKDFAVHNPLCANSSFFERVKTNEKLCKGDPSVVGDIYFEGKSQLAISSSFVVGCLLALLLNVADVLRFLGHDKVLMRLLSSLKVGGLENKKGRNDGVAGFAMDAMLNVEDVQETRQQDARNVMRFQTFMRMSMEGLSYGLMMMVLETEIDGDCVAMRSMFPIRVAVLWSYTINTVTAVIVISFTFFGLLGCMPSKRVQKCMTSLSCCFVVLVSVFVFFAFLAYIYSIVLALYLAFTNKKDSAVIVGAGLAMLSILFQISDLVEPQPSDRWYWGGEKDEDGFEVDDDEEYDEEEEEEDEMQSMTKKERKREKKENRS